jgi:Cu(I)/Ag(I) efflux system membrane protein CusA/SilA
VIARLVAWSARHPWTVIVAALLIALTGELGRRALRSDAIPDLSDPQIVLVADWMGHPASEVATTVTKVLTDAIESVPGTKAVRGTSMSGMAYVDVVFDRAVGLGAGRDAIALRVDDARKRLPPNVRVRLGPLASSTGWVFQYVLVDPTHGQSLLTLRRFQDDVLRPALASIPGVAEVASVGGRNQAVLVELQPERLRERGAAFSDVFSTLQRGWASTDPPSFENLGSLTVDLPPTQTASEPGSGNASGETLRLKDVAQIRLVEEMANADVDFGGKLPGVGGVVVARSDAHLPSLIDQVERTLDRARSSLPPNVQLVTAYNREDLIGRVQRMLGRALGEEIIVVVLVILVFLRHGRSALVPLITLPAVLLLTFLGMWLLSVPATIMSLGGIGIALGMAVDADVVALEACHRRLESLPSDALSGDRRRAIVGAAWGAAPAIVTSMIITAVAFLPVFAFTGESARLLRPLALTKTLVIASAALVSVTLAPALRDRLLSGRVEPEFENPLTRWLVAAYRPFVHFALARPVLTLATAALAVASCLPLVNRLGGEFLPRIDEGDLLFMPTTLPGVPVTDAADQLGRQDRAIAATPEVATVLGKIGRGDTATDPAPFSMVETTVRLRPRDEWPRSSRPRWYSSWAPPWLRGLLGVFWPEQVRRTTAELIEHLDKVTPMPGWTSAWTAPARARQDMMSTGVRTPIGIRIVASDPARLDVLGAAIRNVAASVPGVRSAAFESLGGEPWLRFVPDDEAVARLGMNAKTVRNAADFVLTGGQIGELNRNGRTLRVRLAPEPDFRGPADRLRNVTVRASQDAAGAPVPLGLLGRASVVTEPAMLRTELGELVAYIYVDLAEGSDLSTYVEMAKREIDRAQAAGEIALGAGEHIEWTGQYKLLAAGRSRLTWIVPIVAVSMFGLLLFQFRSIVEALIVLASVPFALVGSIWSLFLLGYSMSAPVWVGLLSVVGLAMQTGVVMVVYIDDAFHSRLRAGRVVSRDDIVAAHAEGTVLRLRPKIMTITTMAAGLLPLLWAHEAGSEIMRRVAAPMIGGLASSAFLTLEVLPVLYTMWRSHQLKKARAAGLSLDAFLGDRKK